MAYLLDTNVMITAARLHYPMDVVPGFWQWINTAHRSGRVFSVPQVRDELIGVGDVVEQWCRSAPSGFFTEPRGSDNDAYRAVADWTMQSDYLPAAKQEFLSVADFALIALARARGFTVVTYEVSGQGQKRIKIPDACRQLEVDCIHPSVMLRRERACLVLQD